MVLPKDTTVAMQRRLRECRRADGSLPVLVLEVVTIAPAVTVTAMPWLSS